MPTAHRAVRDMPCPVPRQLAGPGPGEIGLVELEEQPHKELPPPVVGQSPWPPEGSWSTLQWPPRLPPKGNDHQRVTHPGPQTLTLRF